jgi:acyl phosphate:glycerol-3-phosphate acyltransferase
MDAWLGVWAATAVGYLLGSIPTSVLVGKLFFGKDPRNFGSGNAGGTNSFRLFGWKAGVAVVVVDVAKGAAAVAFAPFIAAAPPIDASIVPLVAGLAAVVGHVWTVFARFRGGKGVATSAGVLAAIEPFSFCATALVFALTITTTGFVSLGSLMAALAFPSFVTLRYLLGAETRFFLVPISWLLGSFIAFTHRSNIARLRRGEEKRFEKLRLLWRRGKRASSQTPDGVNNPMDSSTRP